jgi:hypothetical protein
MTVSDLDPPVTASTAKPSLAETGFRRKTPGS